MRVGLLADIHGNASALRAVLARARTERIDRLLIAGDLVGYYYEPDVVLDLLAPWDWIMVRGNHEDMLRSWIAGEDRDVIHQRYGSGLSVADEALTEGQKIMVTQSPVQRTLVLDGKSVLLCHGSPWDHDAYVYPDAPQDVKERMLSTGCNLVVFGHTHYPVVWRSAMSVVVNPGSVGQPRDRRPGASWSIWDSSDNSIDMRLEDYDRRQLVRDCASRDPQLPFLADVLERTA